MVGTVPGVRCRQITDADIPAVVALLARGFPSADRNFWQRGLHQLGRLRPPPGLPKYGYLLDNEGTAVGTILLICSTMRAGDKPVDAMQRLKLVRRTCLPRLRTAVNLAGPRTQRRDLSECFSAPKHVAYYRSTRFLSLLRWQILRHSDAKQNVRQPDGVHVFNARVHPTVGFDPFEQEMLLQHAKFGCISLWCATSEDAYPFVFRPRRIKNVVPGVQLIYCRDTSDFVRFAGPIGRVLARRGKALVVIDANGPIPGLSGVFRPSNTPKYYRGPERPRLGDLAYTECVVLGV